MNNWCVPLAAFKVLADIIPTMTFDEILKVTIEGIRKQNQECKTNGELGNFWNVMQYLASDGDLIEGGDYLIKYCGKFKTDIVNVEWQYQHAVLFMQKSRIFNLYRKEGRQANEKVLPTDALKYYLQNSKAYLGEKVMRFDVYKKGVQLFDTSKAVLGKAAPKLTTTQRAYCFDYDLLKATFGISITTSSFDEEDERPF